MASQHNTARALPPEEKKKVIFEAARQVILHRGFDGAKMEEIAARAGVGKGTLYNFFDSKEALFLSLVIESLADFRDLIDAQMDPIEDPWEQIAGAWRILMLQVFPDLIQQWNFNYQLWGFITRDAEARDRLFARWREMYREREAHITQSIIDGQASGHFRSDVDARSLALILLSIFDGLLHRTMFDAERIDPEATLRGLLDMIRKVLAKPRDGAR